MYRVIIYLTIISCNFSSLITLKKPTAHMQSEVAAGRFVFGMKS
jgi:hypothetical protein